MSNVCGSEAHKGMVRGAFAGIGKTFRGTIWENCARFRLTGSGYSSMPSGQGGHFQIETARHLAGPLRALLDPNVRQVVIIGATQVMKSVVGDIWIPYIMEHQPRPMLVLFEDDPKAKLFAAMRLMPTILAHPVLAGRISQARVSDATNTDIRLPGMSLKICGLNDGNVSSLSWPIVWASEAWQHKSDGLLFKAIARTDRFPHHKILVESQAGRKDEDLHNLCKGAHSVPLVWSCPMCGGKQSWDFLKERKDGTFSGMMFPASGTIAERAKGAYWECFHCRKPILDTLTNRVAIMDSYEQDYQITLESGLKVSPRVVAFYIPKEAAVGNGFEMSALSYLVAKDSQANGNNVPLADWYMSQRAVFWDEKYSQDKVVTVVGEHDPAVAVKDEHHRGMIIDCQKDVLQDTAGTFWWETYAADKWGNSFQLERGFAVGWKELDEIQAKWKVQNNFVCIDGRKWTPEILQQVAVRARLMPCRDAFGRAGMARVPWRVFMGDAARDFPWPTPNGQPVLRRGWSQPTTHRVSFLNEKGQNDAVFVMIWRWSNLLFKDQLQSLRIGGSGKPKFAAVDRDKLPPAQRAKENGDLAYDSQMNAEHRVTLPSGKIEWRQLRENNHYWDISCMRLVRIAMEGLAGHIAVPQD